MNVQEMTLGFYEILKAGGFTTGGMAFDAKIRRQSLDPEDLLCAHVGSMDAIARGLLNAAALLENGSIKNHVSERYAGWDGDLGRSILAGKKNLDDLAAYVHEHDLEPQPRSGRQEYLESLVNRFN
jgi:xylose isomerase